MPKLKTHTGAKSALSLPRTEGETCARLQDHLLNGHGKTAKSKRRLRRGAYADKTNVATIKLLVPYK
ncbi:MAG: 50S ribosomal protein L35 [Anaerotruncus massiliensis (ex Togo et al. 2019)]